MECLFRSNVREKTGCRDLVRATPAAAALGLPSAPRPRWWSAKTPPAAPAQTATSLLLPAAANAANIAITMSAVVDGFLTVLCNAMLDHAGQVGGVLIQIADAQNEVGKQINRIRDFVASGVDAIIVNTVDSDAMIAMTHLAAEAGIPLVFVDRAPANPEILPDNQADVGGEEVDAGRRRNMPATPSGKRAGPTRSRSRSSRAFCRMRPARPKTRSRRHWCPPAAKMSTGSPGSRSSR